MRVVRVVLDTNVLVSDMFTAGVTSDRALPLALQGAATRLADSRILAAYEEETARTFVD